jgi:hypothetical protein
MAGETNIIPYAGTVRPWDSVIEPVQGGPLRSGYAIRQWLDSTGSTCRGYLYPDGRLIGARFILSASEQAAVDAALAAKAQRDADDATFLAEMETLAVAIRDNAATAAQQRRFIVKLFRMVKGILRDL